MELDSNFIEFLKSLKKDRKHKDEKAEYAEELAVHAYGDKPVKILGKVRPREEPSITQYRLESYECKTKSKFDEACKIMKKMFNSSLYSIDWGETKLKEGESLRDYCEQFYPVRDSVIGYLKEEGLKHVLSNPNGMFCVVFGKPQPQNQYRKPIAKFYKEDKILFYDDDLLIIHLWGELGKDAYYQVFDLVGIYEIQESRTGQKHKFEIVDERTHDFGEIPAWYAGGIIEGYMYKSFFDAAIPFWNKAIAHDSDLDGVYINHAYPYMWSVEIDCTNPDCSNGRIQEIKGDNTSRLVTCHTCQGTGKQLSKSPYDMFTVNKDKLSDNPSIVPPAGYISPNPAIIKALDDKVERLMMQGMEALKMHVVVGENQSGRAKEWDRKELNESIREVSDLMFNVHFANIVYFINKYRYQDTLSEQQLKEQLPTINGPQHFDILTVGDLTSEISEATTAKVNTHYVEVLTKDITNKRYSADIQERDRLNAIIELDPFVGVTVDDKMVMISDGTVDKIDVKISNNIKRFIDRAISEDKEFLKKTNAEKYDILKNYAQEIKQPERVDIYDSRPSGE